MKRSVKPKPLPPIERIKELLEYDKESGKLYWKRFMGGTAKKGSEAGNLRGDGYVRVKIDKSLYLVHRIIWLLEKGIDPDHTIDHEGGDRSNNKISNLRDLTHAENLQNVQRVRSDSKIGLKGVSIDPRDGVYMARITHQGKKIHLGRFKCAEDAHLAYLEARKKYHRYSPKKES